MARGSCRWQLVRAPFPGRCGVGVGRRISVFARCHGAELKDAGSCGTIGLAGELKSQKEMRIKCLRGAHVLLRVTVAPGLHPHSAVAAVAVPGARPEGLAAVGGGAQVALVALGQRARGPATARSDPRGPHLLPGPRAPPHTEGGNSETHHTGEQQQPKGFLKMYRIRKTSEEVQAVQ